MQLGYLEQSSRVRHKEAIDGICGLEICMAGQTR